MGNQIYVGAGGAAFIRNYVSTRRLVGYSSTPFQYTVAGTGVTRMQGMANLVVTKSGQHLLPFQPSPNKPMRALQQQQQQQAHVRTLTAREQEAALATDEDSLAVRLLAGETGRSKLLVVQSYMSEGKNDLIVEDPKLFQAPALKDAWGVLPMLLAKRAAAEASSSSSTVAESKPSPGLISVNNTDCVLCSVAPGATADHLGGLESCHVSDACAAADSPMAAVEAARAAAPAGFDVSSGVPGLSALSKREDVDEEAMEELPGVWMLWHELVVYCRPTDPAVQSSSSITDGTSCLSATYIKDIVRAFLGPEHADDYQLAVASTELPAAVKPLVQADVGLLAALAMQPPRREDAGCQGLGAKYNVYMTANDREVEEYLTREWQAIVADPSDLEATLLQNAPVETSSSSSNKVTPCAIAVKRAGVAKYPNLQNMKGFKPLTSGLAPVGPSVTLASDAAIAPVAEVTEGQAYKVYVQNFMKGAKLSLQLVKGLDRSGPVVVAVESFEEEDESGMAELMWVPPPGLKEREQRGQINKYYLKASVDSFPALFANSQPFTLRTAAAPE